MTHAAAAAAVAEPTEQARENPRPRTAGGFYLGGPLGHAPRRRGPAGSPDRGGDGARRRQNHFHPLGAPRRRGDPVASPPPPGAVTNGPRGPVPVFCLFFSRSRAHPT